MDRRGDRRLRAARQIVQNCSAPSLRPSAAGFELRSLAAARDDVYCSGP
jgi:hypothetical protein